MICWGMLGSRKRAVPTARPVAPARRNSTASVPALDAAHADDGDVVFFGDGGVDAVGHVDGDGFDGGAGEAAGAVGEDGALFFDVDGHGGEGVDEGEAGGAGVDGGLGGDGDVGDVGGEFDDEFAAAGDFFDGGDEVEEAPGSVPKERPFLTLGQETLSSMPWTVGS